MYDILPPILIVLGIAAILVLIIRKMPVLATLPEEELQKSGVSDWLIQKFERFRGLLKYEPVIIATLARFLEHLHRRLLRLVSVSEKGIQSLRMRSRAVPRIAGFPKFLSRIRRRQAYLEEERKLLAQVAGNPEDIEVYKRLGALYLLQGNISEARAAFEQILKVAPQDENAQQKIEELRVREKEVPR